MHIVFVTPFLRVPPDFGLGIRNYHLIQGLASRHQLHVVTYGADDTGETDAWLQRLGCSVTRLAFRDVPLSGRARGLARRLFEFPPASFRRYPVSELYQTLHALQRQSPRDVILFDTQMMGQVSLYAPPGSTSVLLLADIYDRLLWRRLRMYLPRPYSLVYAAEWLHTRRYEKNILTAYRHIVTVSEADARQARGIAPEAEVRVFPNGVDMQAFASSAPAGKTNSLLFVGGFEYGPNVDAVLYFYDRILPLIRAQQADVTLVLVGRKPPPQVQALARDLQVRLVGAVPDVRPFYAGAAVALVPLRYGSGTKLKVLEAFAAQVPVVSTGVGAEGLAVTHNEQLWIADSPQAFAAGVVTLLRDPERARALAHRANVWVGEYDWSRIADRFESYVGEVVTGDR